MDPNDDDGTKVIAELCKRHASLRTLIAQSVSEYMDSKKRLPNEKNQSSPTEDAGGLFQILHLLLNSCRSNKVFDSCVTKFFQCFDGRDFIDFFCGYDALLSRYKGSETFFVSFMVVLRFYLEYVIDIYNHTIPEKSLPAKSWRITLSMLV